MMTSSMMVIARTRLNPKRNESQATNAARSILVFEALPRHA